MAVSIYETIVEESDDGIFVAQDGEIVYTNPQLRNLTGYMKGELDGVPKTQIIAPDDKDRVAAYHQSRLAGEPVPNKYEIELETKDGDRLPVEISVSDGEYEDGRAAYVICRDTRDRKEREADLLELAREYESVFQASEDPLFVLSVDDDETIRFQRFNEREEEFTGKSTEEIRGKTPVEVFGEDLGSTLEANYQQCLDRGEPTTYEEQLQLSGERTYWQTKLTPVTTDGEITRIIGIGREITELKEQQHELEQSRQRLQALFDRAPDSIIVHDKTGDILDVNEQTTDSLGYTQKELIGQNVTDIEVGVDPADLEEYWTELLPGETLKISSKHESQDGTQFPVEVWVTKLEVDDETQYLALTRDITEQVEQRREIKGLNERLKLAVEGAGVGVWDWNMQTDRVEFNEQWAEMLGHSLDDIEPDIDSWKGRVHPDDLAVVKTELNAHRDGEVEYFDCEHRMRTVDGEWKWIRTLGRIVDRDAQGEPRRAVGIHIDVDEQKQREKELQTLRQRFEQFSKNVQDAFFLVSADYSETLYVNDAVEHIYGITPEEAYADPESWLQYVHPDDKGDVVAAMEDFKNGAINGSLAQQERIQHPTRGLRWIQTEINVVTDDDNTVEKIAGVSSDVTDNKQYEQRLETQRNNLDILNQVVRHDIRNDLQLIQAYTELLAENNSFDDTNQMYLSKVQNAATNAVDLTTTARDLAKVMLQADTEPKSMPLAKALEGQINRIRSGHQNAVVTLKGTLPSVDVRADDLLDAVFRNLLKNAIQHNDKPVPEITVDTTVEDEIVRIRVADNGPGVSDSLQGEIFSRGSQGLESDGTVIGLHLVKTLVERYGGSVWVEDNDPEGAVFCIELQLANY